MSDLRFRQRNVVLAAGDWFNRLDWGGAHNNFGVGLPVASKNEDHWPEKRPFLAREACLTTKIIAYTPLLDTAVESAHQHHGIW